MFVSVGPNGFTVTGIVNLALDFGRVIPANFMGNGPQAAFILRIMANWWDIWLRGLAMWFSLVSVGAQFSTAQCKKMRFAMTWYSFVFPNTALVTATLAIGNAFECYLIKVVGTVMAVFLVAMWFFVIGMMVRAVVLKQILWP
jgi:tellurite resistance protein TehA-like permease